MSLTIRFPQKENNIWYFQIFGPDSIDGTIRIARTEQSLPDGDTPIDWLPENETEAQIMVDGGDTNLFTVRQEAKQFIKDNPAAKLLLTLGPDDLETTIENRTENQETLLLKALSFAVRFLYEAEKD